jgi:hypothetical protein
MQMLLDECGDKDFTIHLTYPIGKIDVEREIDWRKEQQKEQNRKKQNPKVRVRDDWSPREHSLAAFFDDHQDFARKVSIVADGQPHAIDLLDKVEF